jgi:hypothetical protein
LKCKLAGIQMFAEFEIMVLHNCCVMSFMNGPLSILFEESVEFFSKLFKISNSVLFRSFSQMSCKINNTFENQLCFYNYP